MGKTALSFLSLWDALVSAIVSKTVATRKTKENHDLKKKNQDIADENEILEKTLSTRKKQKAAEESERVQKGKEQIENFELDDIMENI